MKEPTEEEKKLKSAEIDFQIKTLAALDKVRERMIELMEKLPEDKKVYDELDEVMDVYKTIVEVM